MVHRASGVILSVFASLLAACGGPGPDDYDRKEVLTASSNGHRYTVFVSLPEGHDTASEPVPTLYVLDGDAAFTTVAPMVRRLAAAGRIPKMVVVGIGYGDERNLRDSDLTPTPMSSTPTSGGAPEFHRFIAHELVPWVEQNFRTVRSPEGRCIAGHSYGGLYVFHELLQGDDTFGRFIAASPSLWWDQGVMLTVAKDRLGEGPLHGRLYTSVADRGDGTLMRVLFDEMVTRLQTQADFPLRHSVDQVPYHNVSWKTAYPAGLQFVFGEAP